MTLVGGAELQRALSWIMRQFSGSESPEVVLSEAANKIEIESLFRDVDFYSSNAEWGSNPASFFINDINSPKANTKLVHGLSDGLILDIEFPSSYQVQNPFFQEEFDKYPENKTVHARYWQHSKPAPATVVTLHGWTMGDPRLTSLAFLPGQFYKLGLDVVMFELPYHGRRQPKSMTEKSAQSLFPGTSLSLTNEAIGQVIHDLRTLSRFLTARGAENIGVVGMSLGAYLGALWASLDPIKFCIPIVPLVSMADLAWKHIKKSNNFREFKQKGLTKELLEDGYAIHCPLNHKLKTPKENILILSGLADNIISSAQPRMLWEHWDKPVIQKFRGGHLAQLKNPNALKKVLRFFVAQGWMK